MDLILNKLAREIIIVEISTDDRDDDDEIIYRYGVTRFGDEVMSVRMLMVEAADGSAES